MPVLVFSLAAVLALMVALFLAFMFELSSFLSIPGRRPATPPHVLPPPLLSVAISVDIVVIVVVIVVNISFAIVVIVVVPPPPPPNTLP